MALERVPYPGSSEYQYDSLPALGNRFAIGHRDVEHLTSTLQPIKTPAADHKNPGLETVTASATEAQDAVESEAKAAISDKLAPSSGIEEQFISLPDSPTEANAADIIANQPRFAPAWPDTEETAQPSTSGQDQDLPWAQASSNIRSPLLRLHTEVVEFCRFLEPTAEEAAMREAATQRVREVILSIWPQASVQVFGSFVTGLYLPTSDIDLVVMDSKCGDVPIALKALASSLLRRSMAKGIQVVAKAKVPIIKFIEIKSNINFDISFDVANGPVAAGFVRDLMDTLPPMKSLVLVLKIFLQQREFNEVYTGGIGSYALFVMVAAFLLLHPSRTPKREGSRRTGNLEKSLGLLLVDFFRLFGRTLYTDDVGISCRDGGAFYSKIDAGLDQPGRPFMMSVEDPADPTNDLCRGSWNILKIKQAFDFAYQQLIAPSDPSESLLERIIRLDTVLVERPRPVDPPAPEQLEQNMRDQMHHRSKRSRQSEAHKEADNRKSSSHREKGKKRRRERSLEFMDPDLDDTSPSHGKEKKRRRSSKHHKSDRHSSRRTSSPSPAQNAQHIHFD